MGKTPRPEIVPSVTARVKTGCGNLYVTVGIIDNKPFEVFAVLGHAGGCAACQTEAITKSISQGIRHGVPIEEYIKLLVGIRCPSPAFSDGEEILSCSDAIGKTLMRFKDGCN